MEKPVTFPTDVDGLTALIRCQQEQLSEQSQFIDQLLEQIWLARYQHFETRLRRTAFSQKHWRY